MCVRVCVRVEIFISTASFEGQLSCILRGVVVDRPRAVFDLRQRQHISACVCARLGEAPHLRALLHAGAVDLPLLHRCLDLGLLAALARVCGASSEVTATSPLSSIVHYCTAAVPFGSPVATVTVIVSFEPVMTLGLHSTVQM